VDPASKSCGDLLLIEDSLLHLHRRHQRGLTVSDHLLDIARHTAGALVCVGRVRHWRDDTKVEEEAVVLERQTAAEAHLARDGKHTLVKTVVVVDASHNLTDLLRLVLIHVVGNVDPRAIGLDYALVGAVQDHDGVALGAQEVGILVV